MEIDLGTISAAIVSGGASGALVQSLTYRRDTRELRSKFLTALGNVELARWGGGAYTWQDLRESVNSLNAAAVTSGVPQRLVDTYVAYAAAACLESHDNLEDTESPGIDRPLEEATVELARLCVNAVWRPRRTALTYRRGVRNINGVYDSEHTRFRMTRLGRRHFAD